jgi:hypothetical protein
VAEPELGPLFRKADADLPRLDVDVILERSRRRRKPRVAAVASVLGLAAVGILSTGAYGLGHLAVGTSGSTSSSVSAPAAQPHRGDATCGAVTAQTSSPPTPPSARGLTASVRFAAVYAGESARGTVTLINSGASTVTGSTGSPIVTLSKNGRVVWQSATGGSEGYSVKLAPGESMTLEADLEAGECAPTGHYQVVATIAVDVANGTTATVTTTPTTLSIRP